MDRQKFVQLAAALAITRPPMQITLTIPEDPDGLNLAGIVTLQVDAIPAPRWVDFYVDGAKVASDQAKPYSYSWDTRTVADGTHLLRAEAMYKTRKSQAQFAVTVLNAVPPPPPPPPASDFGAALPTRFPVPAGAIREVSTANEFASALAAVNPGETINLVGNIVGEFHVTRSGTAASPILIRSKPGQRATIVGPETNPSEPLRIEPGVDHVMLHDFNIRNAQGESSQGLYLKDCSYIEMVGLDIHTDHHEHLGAPDTSGTCGIFSSSSSHHCYGWYLNIWENWQESIYAPTHGWYMEGDDHWNIGSIIRDHLYGYGMHLYPYGHRRHVVNCTMVNNKRSGLIVAGSTAVDDEVINCVSVDSPDQEYAYRFDSGSGHKLVNSLGWNPSTTMLTGTTVTNYIAADPLLDAAYRLLAGSPALDKADPAYCPPLLQDQTPRQHADLGATGRA